MRNVKGVLFVDYVRMIRRQKHIDWSKHLTADDLACITQKIDPQAWYPMGTFERLGNAILAEIAGGSMDAVRLFGRLSAAQLRDATPMLVAEGNPMETLMRFRVLRSTFFDFDAMSIPTLVDDHADVIIRYHMGPKAEEAASYQAMGFFEGLLELAGAQRVFANFDQRSWTGDAQTLLALEWSV
jgi:hypothetical protein